MIWKDRAALLLAYLLDRRHRHLLNNAHAETFQPGHALGPVGKQPQGTDIQVGKYLRAHADLALGFALVRRGRLLNFAMKGQALRFVHVEAL